MQLTFIKGIYPDFVGKRSLFVGVGNGPASYNQTAGDPLTVNYNPFYLDLIFGGALDTTGTYIAYAKPSGTGERQTWTMFYTTRTTGAQVGAGTNMSAVIFQIGGIGGQF